MPQIDEIDSFIKIDAVEKQTEKFLSLLDKIEGKFKEVNSLEVKIGGSGSSSGLAAALKEQAEATKQLTTATTTYVTQKRTQSQIDKEAAKAAKEEAKINAELSNSYKQLELSSKNQTDRYKQLAAQLGVLHPLTVQAQKDALNLSTQLKTIDAGAGSFQRNVGNYSSATAGFNNNIRILASELPNAGISLRIFAQSLSNNLVPFIQSIKEVQATNKQLKLDGKEFTSVAKTLGQSLLSTGVITGVAVAIGLKLVDMYEKSKKAALEAKAAVDEFKKSREQARVSDEKNLAKETTALEVLYKTATDLNSSYKNRNEAVKELQKLYPAYFEGLTTEAFLAGKATAAYKELSNAIIIKSEITAAESELEILAEQVRKIEKKAELQKQTNAMFKDLYDDDSYQRSQSILAGQTEGKLQRELNQLQKERAKIVDDILKKQNLIPKLLIDNPAKIAEAKKKEPKAKKEKDNLEAFQADIFKKAEEKSKDAMEKIFNNLNDIELKQAETQEKALLRLLDSLEKGEMGVQEYNARKEQLTKKTEDETLKLKLDSIRKYLEAEGLLVEEIAKIEEKITDLEKQEIEKRNKAREAEALKSAKNLAGFQADMYKNKNKADKTQEDLEKDRDDRIRNQARELYRDIVQAFYAASDRKIDALQKEQEVQDVNYEKQKTAIEDSSLAEEEKNARLKVLSDEKEQSDKQIAERVKAEKRKQAQYDRAQALADIAIKTAQAIIAAVAASPLTGGLPWSAIVAGIGAAQAAIVLSTPIPEFAKGKKASDTYEGAMVWGEAGTEIKIDKNGVMEKADKATLGYTKKGDRIISNAELKKGLSLQQDGRVDKISYDELIRANAAQLNNQTSKLVKAIKSQPIQQDNSAYYLSQLAARK